MSSNTEQLIDNATLMISLSEDAEEELLSKNSSRPKKRKFSGNLKFIVTIICIIMSLYHLYSAIVLGINPIQQRATHLLFVLVLVFIVCPACHASPKNRPSLVDWILVIASILAVGNILIRFEALANSGGRYIYTDIIWGAVTILLVIEATRRSIGWALPIFAIIMLLYGFYGQYIPGPLMHGGFSLKRIVQHLCLSTEGIYGQILGVSSTYIYLFILFGAFLSVTGMSKVFNDLAMALAGSSRGGPAKVSVLASGFMGSISGSTSANVVTTGAFTIPLMKKTGYEKYFAAAVEAAASTGGQIMPPVMGSASFIMADALGVPYTTILKSALIPAILYYLGVWIMVDLRARKLNLSGLPKNTLPVFKEVLLTRGHLMIPLVGIIYMLVTGYNAISAALVGIALSIPASFLRRETWIRPKELVVALENGALGALSVAIACGIIGIIIGITSLTGAILAIGSAILKLSGDKMLPTLILTTMVSIVMGMGLPTTACYILTSTIAAPALIKLGISPIQSHLFVFFYGILSSVTPPVATGAYTAAGLAGSSPSETGWAAVKLALAGFIIPFLFIYSPELLLPTGIGIFTMVRVLFSACCGVACLGLSIEGYYFRKLTLIERAICFAAALLLIDSNWVTDLIGCGMGLFVIMQQYAYNRQLNKSSDVE